MNEGTYTDISIISATYLTKWCGVWLPQNKAEARQSVISMIYMSIALGYGAFVSIVDLYHSENDQVHTMYMLSNIICILMTTFKLLVLNVRKVELADVVMSAKHHFWHFNYDSHEQLIFAVSVKYCKWIIVIICCALPTSSTCYVITPLLANSGRNKSDRVLPVKMWVDWPIHETPYYEMLFTFQAACIYLIGIGYVCPDTFLCMLNVHVMGQFRILQYRMLNVWNSDNKNTDATTYTDYCYTDLKECIRQHQFLIEFCQKLENLYTMVIFVHLAVLSILMGIDIYQVIMTNASLAMRSLYFFHMIGSFAHLCIFTFTCNGLIEESTNIIRTVYLRPWCNLPMSKTGKSLRTDLRMIMTRSLKPCCLTCGGFFPVSLGTFTSLLSSTFSYFTVMRESLLRTENE